MVVLKIRYMDKDWILWVIVDSIESMYYYYLKIIEFLYSVCVFFIVLVEDYYDVICMIRIF